MNTEKSELSRALNPCWAIFEGKCYPVYVIIRYERGRLTLSGAVGSTDPAAAKQYGQILASFPPPFPKDAAPGPYPLTVLHYSMGWFDRDWRDLLYFWEKYHAHKAAEIPPWVHDWLQMLPE